MPPRPLRGHFGAEMLPAVTEITRQTPAQPFTPAGVAALAGRPAGWVAAWWLAALAAAVIVIRQAWTATWEAALDEASRALPHGAGAVADGRLSWSNAAPVLTLHDGPFLGVAVCPDDPTARGRTADVQLVLHAEGFAFGSLFGSLSLPYPPPLRLPLDAVTTPGTWAGWRGPARNAVTLAAAVVLPAAWLLLAALYAPPLWLWCRALGRPATLGACARMAGAALVPGALLMTGAVGLYALGGLQLEGLLLAQPAHLVPGWILCLLAPRHLPPPAPAAPSAGPNPFSESPAPATEDDNPFRAGAPD